MSLLINGMDMPKLGENGDHLWVPSWIEVGKDGKAIICTGTHFDPNTIRSYPIEEIPTPHGRLIDADALLSRLNGIKYAANVEDWISRKPIFADGLEEEIISAPTIIETEE